MKILKQIPFFAAVILLVALIAGCSGMTLSEPTGLKVDDNRSVALLSWNEVADATYYKLNITTKGQDGHADSQRTVTLAKAYYSLLSLDGGDYVFKVKAFDAKGNYRSSDWSEELNYTMQSDNGLTYTLTNANTEYVVTGLGKASGNVVIGDTYKGKPVTSVADRAFYAKSALTSITIGANIKTIGNYAFTGCSNLKTVTFSGNVETIGDYAFQSCSALQTITLPDSVTEIGKYTFRYCRYLTNVILGGNTTTLDEGAFMHCTRLASVNFPETLTTIGKSAFGYCEALTSIELGNGVTEIGETAFVGATNLQTLKFGNSLKTIGESAFEKCENLLSVVIPDSVTSIADSAFADCKNLSDVTPGDGLTSIGRYAFSGTKIYDTAENGVYYVGNWAIDSTSDVDEIQKDKTTTVVKNGTIGIADSAFRERKFSTITLPDSVLYIGKSSFRKNSNLTSIDLNDNVKVIGESAFRECSKLGRGRINLGKSLERIDNYAFAECTDFGNARYMELYYKNFTFPSSLVSIGTYAFLRSGFWTGTAASQVVYVGQWAVGYKVSEEDATQRPVYVKDGTVGIGNYAFYKKSVITDITIPESVQYIGTAAFMECTNLKSVSISTFCPIEEIPDYAFYKCSSLNEVKVPRTVKRIGRSAFYKSGLMVANVSILTEEIGPYAYYGCENLIEVNFDAGCELKTVGEYAFAKAAKLPAIDLPDGVETIGKYAFYGCTSLANVDLGESLKKMGDGTFSSCVALERIVLPETLKEIGERSFYKCTALATVEMSAVEKIGNYAFYRCTSLKNIDLTNGVTTIGDYAFFRCAFENLYILDEVKEIGAHAFNGNISLTLYVQASEVPEDWNARWNSAFRPTVLGCEFATDENGTYVVSFTKNQNTLLNFKVSQSGTTTSVVYSNPVRQGYTFGGWEATDAENNVTVYQTENLSDVPDGTKLTAIWEKND